MSIILNEYEWAENALQQSSLGRHPIETLGRIAKYYLYMGYPTRDVHSLLEAFILQTSPKASLVKWDDAISKSIKYAEKCPLIIIDKIQITKPEIQKINALPGKQQRRLAFTLLCLAKYYNRVSDKYNSWVPTHDTEIIHMANINTSIKRQSLLYHQLRDAGLIKFSKKIDNLSVQVLFEEPGDIVLEITDFRNLGNQYLMYCGEPYFACENCGIVIKQCNHNNPNGGRPRKYCDECATKIQYEQKREYASRKKLK